MLYLVSDERYELLRLGRKLLREGRKVKFIGYMRLTNRRIVYVRVKDGDKGKD